MRNRLTTLVQRSGHKYVAQRMEASLIHRESSEIVGHESIRRKGVGFVAILLIIVLAVGLVNRFLLDKGRIGDEAYVMTADGGQYVKFEGTGSPTWHPVTNPVSARLILGENVNPKKVKSKALENARMGHLMGISDAPASFTVAEEPSSSWATCTIFTPADPFDLSKPEKVETAVLSHVTLNESAHRLTKNQAAVARSLDDGTYWLLLGSGDRVQFNPGDTSIMTALGLTAEQVSKATAVSTTFLSTIPQLPLLAVPQVPSAGLMSTHLPGIAIGSVISVELPDDMVTYVVGLDGVQQVSPMVARLLTVGGAPIIREVSPTVLSNAPEADVIDLTLYPHDVPELAHDASVCSTWDRRDGSSVSQRGIFTASVLPLDSADRSKLVETMPGNRSMTDWYYTRPGRGHFVRTTGEEDDSPIQGQLYWVADNGMRYPLGTGNDGTYDDTLNALGLTGKTPIMAPWSVLQLLPEGDTLSPAAARVFPGNPF